MSRAVYIGIQPQNPENSYPVIPTEKTHENQLESLCKFAINQAPNEGWQLYH
jgi:hypothetical protein